MIRRISSFALGSAVALSSLSALAQDEGMEETGGEEAAATDAPAEEAAPAGGEGEAAASGEAAAEMDGPPDAGGKIKLGLRLGYGLPLGDAAKDAPLNDIVTGKIPIWLDLGYMVTDNLMVGLYGQYALGMYKDCPDGASCSASVIRFGLQGQYFLSPGESLNPWVGLGIGYEMLNTSAEAGGVEAKFNVKGFEFLNLQGGADFAVADNIGIGPFASFSVGQYSSGEFTTVGPTGTPVTVDGDIDEKAMHMWLVLGVRGMFGF